MLSNILQRLKERFEKTLPGQKTYLAGIGLLLLGCYQIYEGKIDLGGQSIMAALIAFGLRASKVEEKKEEEKKV